MKKIKNIIVLAGVIFTCLIAFNTSLNAQILVSEVESDPPNQVGDRCQYVEIRGAAGAAVPTNTYFISINSDNSNPGFLNAAVNISGETFGANGTLTLLNTVQGGCPNRVYPAGTKVLNYFAGLTLGQGSEGFYIVRSTTSLFAGQDLDTNDDGTLDTAVTFVDGFNYISNPEEQFKYGPGPILNTIFLGDVPDAATRFSNDNRAFSAGAFYFGELAADPEEATIYAAPFSANFPTGGMLTPGAPNAGTPRPNSTEARADFDGDGRSDISVFRPSNGTWYINNSTTGFFAVRFGQSGDVILPGDYDGDNRTDFAVRRGTIWIILNSRDATARFVDYGTTSDIPVPRDYDGDGRTDIAVFRPSTGFWFIVNSSTNATSAFQYGQSGDVPVPGDYDGDGRDDLAVYRSGTWFLNQSTAGARVVSNFGASGDLLVPADYDGDGREDIAVFRPANGFWYIINSSMNLSSIGIPFISVQFGQSGDVPVPGDYDGDGRDDLAVYRSGTWLSNQSISGSSGIQFGVSSDLPIPDAYNP